MYDRIIALALQTPWAIEPRMLATIHELLRFRASGGRLTAEELQTRIAAGPPRTSGARATGIAVVPIWGVIAHRTFDASSGMTSTEEIGAYLQRAVADPEVETIVLDASSPGGTITGVPELADQLFAARKKKYMVAISNGEMSSAAYWLGSQAHEVISIPSSTTGSLGVWMLHQDVTAALEQKGIKLTAISAGPYKLETAPWVPLTDEAKAFLQDQVNVAYRDFLGAVARGRGVKVDVVRNGFGQGRVLSADQALETGMIDAIETFPQMITRLAAGKRFDGTPRTALGAQAHECAEPSIYLDHFPEKDAPEEQDKKDSHGSAAADLDVENAALAIAERQ